MKASWLHTSYAYTCPLYSPPTNLLARFFHALHQSLKYEISDASTSGMMYIDRQLVFFHTCTHTHTETQRHRGWERPFFCFRKIHGHHVQTLSKGKGHNPVRSSAQVALYVHEFQIEECWKCRHPTKCLGHPTLKVEK